METKYYLINEQYKHFKTGSLLKIEGTNVTFMQKDVISCIKGCHPKNCFDLSELEANYLKGKPLHQRKFIHDEKIFEKISLLAVNDKCKIRNDLKEYTIKQKLSRKDGLYFTLDHDGNSLTLPSYEIELLDKNNTDYYLLMEKYLDFVEGSLIEVRDKNMFINKELMIKYSIENISHLVKRLSSEDASYLSKRPINERVSEFLREQPENDRKKIENTQALSDTKTTFQCVNFEDLTENTYKLLKKCSKRENFNEFFSNLDFINWMNIIVDTLNTNPKTELYLKFVTKGVRILYKIVINDLDFVNSLNNDENAVKNLDHTFNRLSVKDLLSPKENKLLNKILRLYYYLLKSDVQLDQDVITNMKTYFQNVHNKSDLKCVIALCLAHVIDKQCPLLSQIHDTLAQSYKAKETYVDFTSNDVLVGLGKISMTLELPNLKDDVETILLEITKLLELDESFEKILDKFNRFCDSLSKDSEIDDFNYATELLISKFDGNRSSKEENAYQECLITCFRVMTERVSEDCYFIYEGNDLWNLLENLFLSFDLKFQRSYKSKLLQMIISFYYTLCKYGVELSNEIINKLQQCYRSVNIPEDIKLISGLSLAYRFYERYDLTEDLQSYLINVYIDPPNMDETGLTKFDIAGALGIMAVNLHKPDESLSSQLNNNLKAISKCDNRNMFTDDTKKSLELINDCLKKLSDEFMIIFINERFHDAGQRFLSSFLDLENKLKDNRLMHDCVKTILIILRQLCECRKTFSKTLFDSHGLMVALNGVFKILVINNYHDEGHQKLIEEIMRLYWSIYKPGVMIGDKHVIELLEICFNREYSRTAIKTAAALCMSLIDKDITSNIMELVESYLNAFTLLNPLKEMHGFSSFDIYAALTHISVKTKSLTRSNSVRQMKQMRRDENDSISGFQESQFGKMHTSMSELLVSIDPNNGQLFTKENQAHLKIISEKMACINDESKQTFLILKYFDTFDVYFREFLKVAFQERESSEDEIMIDCVKTILSTIRELCNYSVYIVLEISSNEVFLCILNGVFSKLVDKIYKSPTEKKLIEHFIAIYYYILKAELNQCKKNIPISKIVECFKNSEVEDPIQIVSALCLGLIYDKQCKLMQEADKFLRDLCQRNLCGSEIHGIPRREFCMSLGNMSILPKSNFRKVTGREANPNIDDANNVEKAAEEESNAVYAVESQDYEDCLFLVTNPQIISQYREFIKCINYSIPMNNHQILSNILNYSAVKIDLKRTPDILRKIIETRDNRSILALIKNCQAYLKDYDTLFDLASSQGDDIAKEIIKKINREEVRNGVNTRILQLAFHFLEGSEIELFKCYSSLVKDPNVYIDENDTFLTKMIRNLNTETMKLAISILTFDIHKRTVDGESAISIACQTEDKSKVIFLGNNFDIALKDIQEAERIAYNIRDRDISEDIVKILKDRVDFSILN